MELIQFWDEIKEDGLKSAVLSSPIRGSELEKVQIRPVVIKEKELWQITEYRNHQVFHSNCGIEEVMERVSGWIGAPFKQVQLETVHFRGNILVGKKGTITAKKKRKTEETQDKNAGKEEQKLHDRTKNYILKEGNPVDFLVELSVMTKDGKVIKSRYDKFRQINRYLEFIADVIPALPEGRELHIVDFGCGKSYLTFAMYYYLHELLGLDAAIIGLDLKAEVIKNCQALAERLGYKKLHFEIGDIAGYKTSSYIDMVVSLHACDTATDYALAQASEWKASVILAVPCCQHEVNRQIRCPQLETVLKYGILKERMSALITDAMRAQLLREQGYEVQVLEFIDMEHTPKNILIRAVRRKGMRPAGVDKGSEQLAEFLGLNTTLQKLLHQESKESVE